jgi:hypothetical protein
MWLPTSATLCCLCGLPTIATVCCCVACLPLHTLPPVACLPFALMLESLQNIILIGGWRMLNSCSIHMFKSNFNCQRRQVSNCPVFPFLHKGILDIRSPCTSRRGPLLLSHSSPTSTYCMILAQACLSALLRLDDMNVRQEVCLEWSVIRG